MKPNVCMVAYTDYVGDARVRREAETLAAHAFNVVCLTLTNGDRPTRFTVDGVEVRRDVAAVLVEPLEPAVAHHQQHVEIGRRREEPAAHEHLGEHDADGEQIAAAVELTAHHLLGRHVPVFALERSGLRLRLALLRVRDTDTAEHLSEMFGETTVTTMTVSHSHHAESEANILEFGGAVTRSLKDTKAPLVSKDLLMRLPNLQFFSLVSGGKLYKGRVPVISD
mgnify:CR=1 FL=1